MKKYILFALLLNFCTFNVMPAQAYQLVDYKPLSKDECLENKEKLGLQYCHYNNDHLAGAALACGHIDNLPTPDELTILARRIYNSQNTQEIRGIRNEKLMKELGIWVNERRIFYWSNKENKKTAIMRMFDLQRSKAYPVVRNGSTYVETAKPMVIADVFDSNTRKMLKTNKKRFNLSPNTHTSSNKNDTNHSNYDALVAICTSNAPISDDESGINLHGFSNRRFCTSLCGKNAQYRKTQHHQETPVRICVQATSQDDEQTCSERSGVYKNIKYICECPE